MHMYMHALTTCTCTCIFSRHNWNLDCPLFDLEVLAKSYFLACFRQKKGWGTPCNKIIMTHSLSPRPCADVGEDPL